MRCWCFSGGWGFVWVCGGRSAWAGRGGVFNPKGGFSKCVKASEGGGKAGWGGGTIGG